MKNNCFLILTIFFFNFLSAQIVNIPDANFKAKMLSTSSTNFIAKNLTGSYFKIDVNSDGQIQVSEALQVSYLNIGYFQIASLIGIESFSNLETLYCSNNNLTSLNVTNLTKLKSLGCANNKISTLDVSSLINL